MNALRPMPPVSSLRVTSWACSSCRVMPSSEAMCLQKFSSVIRSSPAVDNLPQRSSRDTDFFCTSSRIAVCTFAKAVSARVAQAFLRPICTWLAAPAAFADLAMKVPSSFLASNRGPFVAFATFSCASLVAVFASSVNFLVDSTSAFASSWMVTGVGNAKSSSPFKEMSGAAASSNFLSSASIAAIAVLATSVMASASFFSFATMCALASSSTFRA
mmetsp:Transcript_28031/g.48857  ORF Transcript_28031/g.48857 Transcript_28031/m.48857 type:complete len:216 (+) Transcript_28031:1301-1948(+)